MAGILPRDGGRPTRPLLGDAGNRDAQPRTRWPGHFGCFILCATLALSAAPGVASAQAPLRQAGIDLGLQPVASPRGSLSLVANPAGLADLGGWELRLQAASAGRGLRGSSGGGWGTFGAVPLGPLVVATSFESRSEAATASPLTPQTSSRLGLGAGFALGDRVSLGAAARWLGGASGNADSPWAWDIGALARPWSWLSLGWHVTGLGDPGPVAADGNAAFTTRYSTGIALRPFAGSDRFSAALDFEWPSGGKISATRLTVQGRPLAGLGLGIQFASFPARGRPGAVDEQQTTLLVDAGLGRWGAEFGVRGDDSSVHGNGAAVLAGVRLSKEIPPSLIDSGPRAIVVPLAGGQSERDGGHSFPRLLLGLDALVDNPAVGTVVFRLDDAEFTWSQVEELRAVIARLRARGKRTVTYAATLGTRGLMVAAATERIVMAPAGAMLARGVGTDFIGLAEALHRLGVQVEAVRFGDHKTAPEMFTRTTISGPLKATLGRIVQRRWSDFTEAVGLGRSLTPTAVEAALGLGVVDPDSACNAMLIDAVATPKDFEGKLREWGILEPGEQLQTYEPLQPRRRRWGRRDRLVVLTLTGDIVDGEGGRGLRGDQIGGAAVARQLEALHNDVSVRGVVVRVDSGGGAVYGSELIHQGLLRLSKAKPTVASMASVAASGGYWLSLGADKIFADRSTITGSIGIWTAKPNIEGLLGKLGVWVDHISAGPGDASFGILQPWTPDDRARVERSLRAYYALFLERVEQRRKIGAGGQNLNALAEGRLWLGDEAHGHRLVDRQAGLLDALADVRQRAGIARDDEVQVLIRPRPRSQLSIALGIAAEIGLGASEDADDDDAQGDATTETAAVAARQRVVDALAGSAGPWLDRMAVLTQLPAGTPLALSPLTTEVPER